MPTVPSTTIFVPTSTPGFSAPRIEHKMSLRASVTSELVLEGVRLPASAVLPEARGTGAGVALMHAALDELRARGVRVAKLGAQTHAIGFYERLGFTVYGPEYDDAGIPHRDMSLAL